MKQRVINESAFYKALGKLDLLAVELNDTQKKTEEIKQAMIALQRELYNAVASAEVKL